MPQLIARPGRNAVRQAKKAKEIRHVKGAIIWHEKQRRAHREKIQDRWEVKDKLRQVERWTREEVTLKRKTALRHAAEDWKLGPLRPNRGVNVANGKYAVVTTDQVSKPPLDAKVLKAVNAKREKKGLAPAYPLIVDDKKYFPIVKGDRVVITKGKDKSKIGEVSAVMERSHGIIVRGLNKAYMDTDGISSGGNIGPRVATEMPFDMEDARLVIPYASTSFGPNGQSLYEDVIVDNIVMERHTTGIDPFTGIDYGNQEIPKEHQYDPETGLPIFHRYIAGTPYRIAWPWETETKAGTAPGPSEKAAQGWLSKTLGTLRHPITTLQSWRNPTREEPAEESAPSTLPIATQVEDIEASERMEQRRATLRSEAPENNEAHAADTERYMVEGNDSMSYTLVAPPFPPTLSQELRGDIFAYTQAARNDPENPHKPVRARFLSPKAEAAQAFAQKKAEAALRMKTPLQLRWEQEQARKLQAQKETPAVDTETLLAALGQHMQANGVKKNGKRRAASQAAELD